ncbi:MAG: MerR family transcriptional regulator [Deltaproteobacteria bacterium]|nr:MerR family transcriptional regulator [Deltaproteobacteria bacterium]
METLTTGQLARKAKVNLETIRYYERRGLIVKPPRNESGYRQYSPEDLLRFRFISRAKALGFSLKEIIELLSLRRDPGMTCNDVKERVEAKIVQVERKIETLEIIRAALSGMVKKCTGKGPAGHCPFLQELESREKGKE